jgi:hypothetical protein
LLYFLNQDTDIIRQEAYRSGEGVRERGAAKRGMDGVWFRMNACEKCGARD